MINDALGYVSISFGVNWIWCRLWHNLKKTLFMDLKWANMNLFIGCFSVSICESDDHLFLWQLECVIYHRTSCISIILTSFITQLSFLGFLFPALPWSEADERQHRREIRVVAPSPDGRPSGRPRPLRPGHKILLLPDQPAGRVRIRRCPQTSAPC